MMRRERRGSMYVTVLASSTLIAVVGLSGLALARIARRSTEATNETAAARAYAQSAIEMAAHAISLNKNWRTGFTHGTWSPELAIGDGTYAFKLVDEKNGSLTLDSTAPVRIHGRGTCGDAVRIYSVQVGVQSSVTDNLLENADFEAGTLNWSNFGSATLTTSSADPHGGAFNLFVSNRGSASSGPMQDVTGDIASGKTYQADVWLKTDAGTVAYQVNLNLTLIDFTTLTYTIASGTVGTSWQLLSGTVSPPPFTELYLARLIIRTQTFKGDFSVDDVALFEVGTEVQTLTPVAGTWRQEINP